MMFIRTAAIGAAIAALACTAPMAPAPARAETQAVAQAPAPTVPAQVVAQASPPDSVPAPAAAASPAVKKTLRQRVKRLIAKITPDRVERDIEFKKASALFPDFCKHWEQDLHDREINNLSKLTFVPKGGFETTTYTGYGKVTECESHQSKDGYSIGKISYEEFVYYLAGKSDDEARHAPPKEVSDTHTTEIFRWDNGKWFY